MLKFLQDTVCRVEGDHVARFYKGSYLITDDYTMSVDPSTDEEVFLVNYNGKTLYVPVDAVEETLDEIIA